MLKKTQKRPKTCKNELIKPIKIDSNINSKISNQKDYLDYYDKLKDIYLIKNNNNSTLYNTENNILKLNNSNYIKNNNSFIPFHDSFYLKPKLKSRTFRINQEKNDKKIKIPMKNKIISLKKNKKFKTEDIKLDKEDLLLAAYKNNPEPLLESILRKTNLNKDYIKENDKDFFNNSNNRMKSALETMRKTKQNKEKRKLKINKNINQEKKLLLNKNEQYMELIQKKNNMNNINNNINNNSNVTFTNKKIEHCIAINNNCYNPILQYLDNTDYIRRNRFYRSKTENIDDIKNKNSNSKIKNNGLKTNNNFWNNFNEKSNNNLYYNKINIESIKSENDISKIKKKEYVDASSDTSLDNIFSNNFNNFQKKIINKENPNPIINKENPNPIINNSNINLGLNNNNKYKAYRPKYKLYKNSKYFNKSKKLNKIEDKKNNSNINDVKYYNFNYVVDLFGKKIELCKKPKILSNNNNFRNSSCKFYSCSNNINISLLRKNNFKKLKNIRSAQPNKDSNKDFIEDIEASITKKN